MQRRNFLKGLGTLVGGLALNEAIPLGRVWSFPKEIKIAQAVQVIKPTAILVHPEMAPLTRNISRGNFAQLLAPGIYQVFREFLELQEKEKEYEQVFNVRA